jgi:hypothetical protein
VQIEPKEDRREKRKAYRESIGRKDYPGCLAEQVATPKFWPTPTQDSVTERTKKYSQGGTPLTLAAKMWPTPQAKDHDLEPLEKWKVRAVKKKEQGINLQFPLRQAVQKWPTPTARDYKDSGENTNYEKLAKKGKLAGAVMWPTPTATERSGINPKTGKGAGLSKEVKGVETVKGSLNPDWVEWLMGLPIGFTNLISQE